MQIPTRFLAPFAEYARLRQVPVSRILARAGCAAPLLTDRLAVMPFPDFLQVLEAIVAFLPQPDLGLQVARSMELEHIGIVNALSLKTSSLREALFYCHDYLRQSLPFAAITTPREAEDAFIEITVQLDSALLQQVITEFVATLVARELRVLTGSAQGIKLQWLPEDARLGACRIHFNAGLLPLPAKDYQRWGFETLVPAYLQLLEQLKTDTSFTSRVKQLALGMASPLLPGLEQTAAAFYLTPRTLQRRLSAEGTSFAAVRNTLKRDLCTLLLQHKRFSLPDIGLLLGYAEQASFYHAYRKWYGRPPLQRRSHTA